MAPENREGADHLTRLAPLLDDPRSVHIFHALRLVEATYRDAPRLGESKRSRQDRLRLRQEAEMAFPPTTISRFAAGAPAELVNRFFGFFGPNGPLPLHLTEYARARDRNHRDRSFIGFADMLTHRLMSLLYRAWSSAEPAPGYDRGDDGPFERRVAAVSGFHGTALRDRDAFPDLSKRHFAAHLARGPKNPDGLEALLSAFFGATVRVEEFVGSWLELEPDDRWQLGSRSGLGQTTTIGDRVWSRAAKFRLRIGPLSRAQYEALLPGAPALTRLRDIVRSYAGLSLDWDLNLVLCGDEVPGTRLGATSRLGQTSWLRSGETPRPPAADLYLQSDMMT